MNIRRVPATACIEWFKRAIDLGSHKPGAVFGAAATYLAILIAVMLVVALGIVLAMVAGTPAGQDPQMPEMRTIMMWMIPLMIAITVLSQVLLGGLVGVVASSAQKQDVKASHIFRAFASERIFKLMGLLALTLFSWVCTYIIYYVFGGPEYLSELIEMIQNIQPGVPPVEPEAAHPILMNLASWLVGLVIGFVTLLSVPAVMLRGQLPLEAIAVGFRAVLKNAAAFAFMTLVFIVAMIVLVIVMFVVALILGVIAAVLPIIGVPIIFAVLFTLFVVSMLLWSAVAYFAWQDILGDQQDTAADATSNEVAL